jgi:hypothetical protein
VISSLERAASTTFAPAAASARAAAAPMPRLAPVTMADVPVRLVMGGASWLVMWGMNAKHAALTGQVNAGAGNLPKVSCNFMKSDWCPGEDSNFHFLSETST